MFACLRTIGIALTAVLLFVAMLFPSKEVEDFAAWMCGIWLGIYVLLMMFQLCWQLVVWVVEQFER